MPSPQAARGEPHNLHERDDSEQFRRSYTIESRCFASVGAKTLNTNGIELSAGIVTGVCDNQFAAVRKLLILTRRDGRVVEGARLEIALAICDGVLQISITVAKPTT